MEKRKATDILRDIEKLAGEYQKLDNDASRGLVVACYDPKFNKDAHGFSCVVGTQIIAYGLVETLKNKSKNPLSALFD